MTSPSGRFTSPRYPNMYPHGVNCTWFITVAANHAVRLTFTDFNVEHHANCDYDAVSVYDTDDDSSLIGK